MRRKHPFPFIPFLVVVVCAPAWAGIGTITTIAGGGPKNVQATRAHLHNPTDVVTDSQGNIYIVTSGQNEVFRVDAATGVLTAAAGRSEEHTSELQSLAYLVCRLLLEKKKNTIHMHTNVIVHVD